MKNIKIKLLLICLSLIFIFSGCGSKGPDDLQIGNDLIRYLETDEEIVEIKKDKKTFSEDKKMLTIQTTITTKGSEIKKVYKPMLVYAQDDKDWILDYLNYDFENDFEAFPLSALSPEDIEKSLYELKVTDREYVWTISKDNIRNMEILSQETDLEGKKDRIKLKLYLSEGLFDIGGELDLKYKFTDKWILDKYDGENEFTATMDKTKIHQTTEEEVVKYNTGTDISIGSGGLFSSSQKIRLNSNDISQVTIDEPRFEDEFKKQISPYSFEVVKDIGTLQVNGELTYKYLEGKVWEIQDSSKDPLASIKELNILGPWSGKMDHMNSPYTATLDISEVSDGGNITAILSYESRPENEQQYKGKVKLVGTFDYDDGSIKLKKSEWLEGEEFKNLSNTSGYIYFANSSIVTVGVTELDLKKD